MVLRPARVWTSSPICSSCTRRSPEGVEILVPFSRQRAVDPPPFVVLCADAELLVNASKGILAAATAVTLNAPIAVTLSSCRRVYGCSLFMLLPRQGQSRTV